jgi:RNA recognition motif-containing protein
MNIYVGNLPYTTNADGLRSLFEAYGTVDTASIVSDKFTGQSRGFGFVEMSVQPEAEAAIEAINQMQFQGRALVVNLVKSVHAAISVAVVVVAVVADSAAMATLAAAAEIASKF